MSFSWSISSNSSFHGIKQTAPNSFADALKRLAEHVEEKNKINANNHGTSDFIQTTFDFPNRTIPLHFTNPILSEQALRLYTQYIHESEKRDDVRRTNFRTCGIVDNSNNHNNTSPIVNRDSYRFMTPCLSNIFYPSIYFQTSSPQSRIATSILIENAKNSSISNEDNNREKKLEMSTQTKSKSKLFRPYDLDDANVNSPKKSTVHLVSQSNSSSTCSDDLPTVTTSSGKEKQLFNSLGLVQQSIENSLDTNLLDEKSTTDESDAPVSNKQEIHQNKSLSTITTTCVLKRKSVFSSNSTKISNAKQAKFHMT